jgi:hypothetical protein
MKIFNYPFYHATPSNNRPELFCNNPLPGLSKEDQDIIIYEPYEADYPGPEMSDGTPVMHKIEQLLSDYDKDRITYISANLDLKVLPFCNNIKYYPYHFLDIQRKNVCLDKLYFFREKHFCSLNGAIKHKRIKFVRFCEQNNLIKNNYVSLVGNYDHGYNTQTDYTNYYLDKSAEELNNDDKSIPVEIYKNSYLNIINETHEDEHVFFTEKTWKPILNYQLFLYYGVGDKEKYYKHLIELGFKLYEEFFDYSNDTLVELEKFCKKDIEDIRKQFYSVTDKLAWNRNLAMNLDLKKIKKELNVKDI